MALFLVTFEQVNLAGINRRHCIVVLSFLSITGIVEFCFVL